MNNIQTELSNIGLIPVVILNDAKNAVPLAKALCAGGIPTAEVTFRTAAAKESIAAIHKEVPQILVGAGTITSVDMAKEAVDAGAKYIVSPGLNPDVVNWCLSQNVPIFPGVATPTEIEKALSLGLTTLKFFPAELNGGISILKALASPYRSVSFIPTGGIGLRNMNDYLNLPNVAACGGSWICPADMIDRGQFDKITELCMQSITQMHNFQLLHIGINSVDESEAKKNSEAFAKMFNLPISELPTTFFVGTAFEVVKSTFLGEKGHIAISVNNVERAIAYFEKRGYSFRSDTIVKDEKGIVAVYLKDEIGGFAIHLRRKLN